MVPVGLANTGVPALIGLGQVVASVPLAIVVHLLLAFPPGRLRDASSRVLVAAAYAVALVLQAPQYLFASAAPPFDVLQLVDAPALARAGMWVQRGAGALVLVTTSWLLAGRLRTASAGHRRVLGPLYGYGIAAVLVVPVAGSVLRPAGLSPLVTVTLQVTTLALVPLAFAGSIFRGGFARTAEVEELGMWLGAGAASRPRLRDALASALGDPSLELAYWVRDGYVDDGGNPYVLPPPGADRGAVDIDRGGVRVGAIVYDATTLADPEPVRAAGRVIAIELDRERLTAELRASREALRHSRRRLVEAGDRRQRRIARDLHDGLQNRLVVLALAAHRAGAVDVRRGLEEAIDELRSLVAGMVPPLLLERGLVSATRELADRLPLPVRVEAEPDADTLTPDVAQTAYFIVAETLTNVVKHAKATEVSIRLDHLDDTLRLDIRDDGAGGATLDGTGLRGIADRVDVAGGRLHLDSPDGGGTRLVAELPCAS